MRNIEVGREVIDAHGNACIYGGTNEHGRGWTSHRFDMLNRVHKIFCDAADVAPAEVVEAANIKDVRITATNRKADKPRSAPGPWFIEIPGHTNWAKTKRDGTLEAARRLAIQDWHEGN